mmetsp:Transcript_99558/g.249607  ORF Transcript_99558/g.249607 Transcript_99558/m.249607 type:complete len:487 (+) Transcript_99558:2-1462(+)
MRMIGISNIASGLASGFTGSYIFSQTIFTQRQKVTSKMAGIVLCVGEIVLFVLPIDILQFFPGFFIGGIMAFFGIDIMLDWLVNSRSKVSFREYLLVWFTFIAIMLTSLINGIAIGTAASACLFLLGYSHAPVFQIKRGLTSSRARSGEVTAALLALRGRIACIEFHGYLFFGAAIQISGDIQEKIKKTGATEVILDFEKVSILDSTSAQAISALVMALQGLNINITFSAVGPKEKQMYRLLANNGALNDIEEANIVDHVDEAIACCESRLLQNYALVAAPGEGGREIPKDTIGRIAQYLSSFCAPVGSAVGVPAQSREVVLEVAGRMEERLLDAEQPIFARGEPCNEVFLVLDGCANLEGLSQSKRRVREPKKRRRQQAPTAKVVRKYGAGSLMGVLPFQVAPSHTTTCRAGPTGCKVAVLSRDTLRAMIAESPQQAILVQSVFLRHIANLTQMALTPHTATETAADLGGNGEISEGESPGSCRE